MAVAAPKWGLPLTFQPAPPPSSLVISNFVTGEGEVLAKNVEGYDGRRQVESVRRLFEVLKALMDWEAGS
jgi:hypothetical protein